MVVKSGDPEPTTKCCQDATCAENTTSGWVCSKSYADVDASLGMCPQRAIDCGNEQYITFDKDGESKTITVKGLADGESCTFKIKAKCGAPGFRVLPDSTATLTNFDITFVEYTVTDPNSDGKLDQTAAFRSMGKMGSGQKRPPRIDAQGNVISSKNLGEPDGDRKPPPMFADSTKQKDSYSSGGFGSKSSGTYDGAVKGFKTFGTIGQGDMKMGVKDNNEGECAGRFQLVTVTAKATEPA